MSTPLVDLAPVDRARAVRDRLPVGGLFAGQDWRISPAPFALEPWLVKEFETLGRVLLQFYRAVNLLYRQSLAGKQPAWVSELLDQGKPESLLQLQRGNAFKNDVPRVLRPDCLLTDHGLAITELDSVPGGIGLTAWLNSVYHELGCPVLGGATGMMEGFAGIFGPAARVHVMVSEESATYRPEMEWLLKHWRGPAAAVRDTRFTDFQKGDAVYRFFELFDLANVPAADRLFADALEREVSVTPPPKPIFEEKLLLGLLWNRNLRDFWHRELGESFLERLRKMVPYTWVVDPAPLPPQGAIPELNLTGWDQLKALSQRERDLILKVSGYSDKAWGARGVHLGSDLSTADWSVAVDQAISSFGRSPYVLQRYHKPRVVESTYVDFDSGQLVSMPGRVRLCPYYFVTGSDQAPRAQLGGVLATICPAEKKIIHGMKEAILAPCSA